MITKKQDKPKFLPISHPGLLIFRLMNNFHVIGLAIALSRTGRAMLAETSRLVNHFKAKLILIHVDTHGPEEERKINEMLIEVE